MEVGGDKPRVNTMKLVIPVDEVSKIIEQFRVVL